MSESLDAMEAIFSDPDAWAPDDITAAGLALIERVRRAEGALREIEATIARVALAPEQE